MTCRVRANQARRANHGGWPPRRHWCSWRDMATAIRLIGRGIALGVGAAVPIGPVNVEIARRTFRGGFPAGFALGCGAVTIDVTYAILSSLSLKDVLTRPAVLWPITIGGIAFLFYLAFLSLRGAARDW